MNKKRIWKLEYTVTLFIFIGIILVLLPVSIGGTRQANLISKWNERYNRVDYMFTVIKANMDDTTQKTFNNAKTASDRETLALALIKPYLRIDTSKKIPKRYRQKYMDKNKVIKDQEYELSQLYFDSNNGIIRIKNINSDNSLSPIYMMMFDLNGIMPPNTWGKDIFGINVYKDMTIKPFGQDMTMDALSEDCSPTGTGA